MRLGGVSVKRKTKFWICPKCTRSLTVTFLDTNLSTMDTVEAAQKLTRLKLRHKQIGCEAHHLELNPPSPLPAPIRSTEPAMQPVRRAQPPASSRQVQSGGLFGSIKKLFGG